LVARRAQFSIALDKALELAAKIEKGGPEKPFDMQVSHTESYSPVLLLLEYFSLSEQNFLWGPAHSWLHKCNRDRETDASMTDSISAGCGGEG
jgi:hypothetical protein